MENKIDDYFFKLCPLCSSEEINGQFISIEKDMSEKGYSYNKCKNCHTYYAADGTLENLNTFYAKLPPYQSASSKNYIVDTLVRDLKISSETRILDIGCGSGAWALPFLQYCKHITCVDTDANAVLILSHAVPDIYKSKADCIAMDCDTYLDEKESKSFDIVLSMFSFEHQLYPVKFLKQLNRMLADGGRAIVLVPSGDALQLKILGNAFYWAQAPWHTFLPTEKGFNIAASQAGFGKIEVYQPGNNYYSWFWLRGLSDKLKCRKVYNQLRRYSAFVKLDMAMDKIFDKISFSLGKPSYRFYVISR